MNKNLREKCRTIDFRRQKKKPWIRDDVLILVDERRALKSKAATNPSLMPVHRAFAKRVQKCSEKPLTELEESHQANDLRTVYNEIKVVQAGLVLKVHCSNTKDRNGQVLTQTMDIAN